jgi:hypothetical protein
MTDFSALVGKTLTHIDGGVGDDAITFITSEGERYRMHHIQDCCESVEVDDICGDLSDLIGSPIVLAEESASATTPDGVEPRECYGDSETWTFYRLATAKGFVTIRWYGTSNGYYSESVYFERDGE